MNIRKFAVRCSLISVVIIMCVVVPIFAFQWRRLKNLEIESCIASIYVKLNAGVIDKNTLIKGNQNWTILDKQQKAMALKYVSERFSLDCRRNAHGQLDIQDGVRIAARRSSNGVEEYIVWFIGKDGQSGTDDDIVSPDGASLPEEQRQP